MSTIYLSMKEIATTITFHDVLLSFLPMICFYISAIICDTYFQDESSKTGIAIVKSKSKSHSINNTFTKNSKRESFFMLLLNGILNLFAVRTLFYYWHPESIHLRQYDLLSQISPISGVFCGMLIVDTIEYWFHRTYHKISFLYNLFHYVHHSIGEPQPYTTLVNGSIEVVLVSLTILFSFLIVNISFIDYIIVSSLAMPFTVWDHTTPKNKKDKIGKFHYVHHCVNKNYNFEQPFFTFWDHLMGTYYHPS